MVRKQVGLVVFDDVEVLDFCGPFEVLSTTRLHPERRREEPSPFQVRLIAPAAGTVSASGGLKVVPDHTLADCPALDWLLVPGGWGTRREMDNAALIDWIGERAAKTELLASICTGALLLARAGLLDGLTATTHWASLDLLREIAPKTRVVADQHVVDNGRVVTSAGISAGIDMALRLVARECGEKVARETARHMEYPYPDDNRRRV